MRRWLRIGLGLIERIRELETALADALYWLKPGMSDHAQMARDRRDLSAVLHGEVRAATDQERPQ